MSGRGGLWWYVVARTVSWVGSAVTLVALPVLLFRQTGDPALTALATALEALPYLLFGLPAGALADRWDRRRTLVATACGSALLVASVPVAHGAGVLTAGQVLAVAAGSATLFVLADAAGFGLLPAIVGRDGVARATGILNTANTLVVVLGPALGGVLVAMVGAAPAMAVDAASFLLAAVLTLGLRPARPERERSDPAGRGLRAEIVVGLRFLLAHRGIRAFTLLGVGNSLSGGAVLGLVVVAAVQNLGLRADDARVGLLYAAAGVGSLVAGLGLPWVRSRLGIGMTGVAGFAVGWCALCAWAASGRWVVGGVALAVWQAAHTLVNLNAIVFRQEVTPEHLQGRVNTTARMIAWGGQPIGAVLGGVVAAGAGVRVALLVASGGLLASLVGALAGPLRLTGPTGPTGPAGSAGSAGLTGSGRPEPAGGGAGSASVEG